MKYLIVILALAAALWVVTEQKCRESEPLIDPSIKPYVEEWKRDMDRAGIDYRAAYGRLDRIEVRPYSVEGAAGETQTGARTIIIYGKQIERGEYSTRETVYHELGHWVFHLEHGSCTIMETNARSNAKIEARWSEAVDEYLEACKKLEINSKY